MKAVVDHSRRHPRGAPSDAASWACAMPPPPSVLLAVVVCLAVPKVEVAAGSLLYTACPLHAALRHDGIGNSKWRQRRAEPYVCVCVGVLSRGTRAQQCGWTCGTAQHDVRPAAPHGHHPMSHPLLPCILTICLRRAQWKQAKCGCHVSNLVVAEGRPGVTPCRLLLQLGQ